MITRYRAPARPRLECAIRGRRLPAPGKADLACTSGSATTASLTPINGDVLLVVVVTLGHRREFYDR